MKNPFKKSNIVDTAVNVAIGGGANAIVDYAFGSVDALQSVADYKSWLKLCVGVLGGSLISNKYARAAADGLSVVGASEIIKEYLPASASAETETPAGVPFIGRPGMRMGQRGFKRAIRGTGKVGTVPFMG